MGPQITFNHSTFLITQAIFIMLLMFPDFSLLLWKSIVNKWALAGEKLMIRRSRTAEEKLKKYWEIDMRKFK